MIRSYQNQTEKKERGKEKDRVSAERREARGSWRRHRRECMQHGNPEGEQFYLFHQEHIPSSPLSISNSILGSPSYYPLLDSVHLVIYTWCIRIPFYALRAPSKRERLVTVCILLIAFFFYENRFIFIALQIPFKNNSSLGYKRKNNEWSMPNSIMASTQSYSRLHLLVKRSRRNNRDSLAATEIPRRLFSFSLSFSPSSLSPSFFSFHLSRALPSRSLSRRTAFPSCIWMKLFCREPKKRHAVKRLALIHSCSQPTPSPCYHPRGEASRDDNSKLVPGIPFGPFVRSRYRFEERHTYPLTSFTDARSSKQIGGPADLTRK